MREIKFRVWNGEEMISPDYITRDGTAHWRENSIPQASNELMQYTGLKDKNGSEIYEGDITEVSWYEDMTEGGVIPAKKGDKLGYVVWKDDSCSFVVKGKTKSYHIEQAVKNRIIGNIYQNPEILKETKNAIK